MNLGANSTGMRQTARSRYVTAACLTACLLGSAPAQEATQDSGGASATGKARTDFEKPAYEKIPPGIFEKPAREYTVYGNIATSDGKSFSGVLYSTLGKPLTIFDRESGKFVEFSLGAVARLDVAIEEEREEPYWYWKESGSDEKVFTGRTYPWRKYVTTVTLSGGRKLEGDMSGIIYLEVPDARPRPFVLHKRQKGKEGQKPSDLVYVRSVAIAGAGARASGPGGEPPSEKLLSTSD